MAGLAAKIAGRTALSMDINYWQLYISAGGREGGRWHSTLLKWQYQPTRRQTGHSWRSTIRTQRQEIAELPEQSPSLRQTVLEALSARYALAREYASDQTHLLLGTFPATCPWTVGQLLNDTFWPQTAGEAL